jgi:hypothetical protein
MISPKLNAGRGAHRRYNARWSGAIGDNAIPALPESPIESTPKVK